jgi:hypothetical protein
MESEGHDPIAAENLRSKGLLASVNLILNPHDLVLVLVREGNAWVPRIEAIHRVDPEVPQIDIGLDLTKRTGMPYRLARAGDKIQWGLVGDDGKIPIPAGYVILDTVKIEGERFAVYGHPSDKSAKTYDVPETDIPLVMMVKVQ